MANLALWNLVSELKSEKYKWVDLTHELSPETPHWYGFNPLEAKLLFDYVEGTPEDMMAPMRCFQVSVASQYGTHVDVPRHFWGEGRSMESIDVTEMVMPLVVVEVDLGIADVGERLLLDGEHRLVDGDLAAFQRLKRSSRVAVHPRTSRSSSTAG